MIYVVSVCYSYEVQLARREQILRAELNISTPVHSLEPMLVYTNTWIEQNAQPHRRLQYLPYRQVPAVCSVGLSMNTMTSLIYVISYYRLQSDVPSQVGWSLLQDDALASLFSNIMERIIK
jgi:hypothetical protein